MLRRFLAVGQSSPFTSLSVLCISHAAKNRSAKTTVGNHVAADCWTSHRLTASSSSPSPSSSQSSTPTKSDNTQTASFGEGTQRGMPQSPPSQAEVGSEGRMSDAEFEDSVKTLKTIVFRGFRAFVVLACGLGVLSYSLKAKRGSQQPKAPESGTQRVTSADDADDPTARYLKEMENIGWDVKTHEEELAKSRKASGTARSSKDK